MRDLLRGTRRTGHEYVQGLRPDLPPQGPLARREGTLAPAGSSRMQALGGLMSNRSSLPALAGILVVAAGFILLSSQSLPPVVASHFAAGGNADGFMPRNAYLAFMLFIAVGVPLLLALANSLVRLVPPHMVSLPNRDYWLAPERAADTLAFLRNHGTYFSVLLAAFLTFVHWLVVRANALQPPRLSAPLFIAGLVLFLLAVAIWVGALILHFRRRP